MAAETVIDRLRVTRPASGEEIGGLTQELIDRADCCVDSATEGYGLEASNFFYEADGDERDHLRGQGKFYRDAVKLIEDGLNALEISGLSDHMASELAERRQESRRYSTQYITGFGTAAEEIDDLSSTGPGTQVTAEDLDILARYIDKEMVECDQRADDSFPSLRRQFEFWSGKSNAYGAALDYLQQSQGTTMLDDVQERIQSRRLASPRNFDVENASDTRIQHLQGRRRGLGEVSGMISAARTFRELRTIHEDVDAKIGEATAVIEASPLNAPDAPFISGRIEGLQVATKMLRQYSL